MEEITKQTTINMSHAAEILAADVLAKAVASGWNDIGKPGAIAILRTALNYFIGKELNEIKHASIVN
jgi:uncharacterized membrane protein